MFKSLIEQHPLKAETNNILLDDEASAFPREVEKLLQNNILLAFVPNTLGGKMGSIDDTLHMGRLLSRRNLTAAIALGQTLLGSLPVWLYGSESQKKELTEVLKNGGLNCLALTEEENGSDLSMTKVSDSGGAITGKKWCINNATKGRALSVLTLSEGGILNVHLVLKDKAHEGSFTNISKINTLGIRGADISGIIFDHFSQQDSLIGRAGQGQEIILKTMQISRLLCASFSLGAADTTLRRALEFSTSRILYGKEAIHIPAVKSKLQDSYRKLLMIEAFAIMCSRFVTMAPEVMSLYSAISKYYVTKLSDEIIQSATEVIGARFYIRDSDFGITQKMMRDHRVVSLFDGNSDVNMGIIAGQLKRLSQTSPLKDDAEFIYHLKNPAPDFTGDEKLRLTNRGRDIIWEAQTDKDLLNKREALFTKVNGVSDIQSPEMLALVEEYCELTLKANYQLFHVYNHKDFSIQVDLEKMMNDESLDIALPLDQLQKKCLFSHFHCEIND